MSDLIKEPIHWIMKARLVGVTFFDIVPLPYRVAVVIAIMSSEIYGALIRGLVKGAGLFTSAASVD